VLPVRFLAGHRFAAIDVEEDCEVHLPITGKHQIVNVRMPLLTCALLAALPAAGDPLSDLRAVLQRYPAKTPFAFSASLHVNGDSQGVAGARGGSTTFEVEVGAGGLMIRVPPSALGAAESEAETKKRDPENLTPTRTAMVAVTIFDVIDAIDAATMLLNDLDGATLIQQTPSTHAGKVATLLRIKVKPTLAGTSGRFVNEPRIELRVWTESNGIPVAAERDSNYSASFVFLKAENVRKERWELAVAGDHLYASRNDEENRASAVGKSVVSSRSVIYVPK
jgi:hypothetical protein